VFLQLFAEDHGLVADGKIYCSYENMYVERCLCLSRSNQSYHMLGNAGNKCLHDSCIFFYDCYEKCVKKHYT
jgi:hypothetical protein